MNKSAESAGNQVLPMFENDLGECLVDLGPREDLVDEFDAMAHECDDEGRGKIKNPIEYLELEFIDHQVINRKQTAGIKTKDYSGKLYGYRKHE